MSAVVAAIARAAPSLLRTAGSQRLNILIYHRVLESPDPLRPDEPTVQVFDWQMALLRRSFTPLPLLEAVQLMRAGELPERAVCVTFDDGYADNEQLAAPVLSKYAVPATVFVSTGYLNGGCMFNDLIIEAVRASQGDTLDLREFGLGLYDIQGDEQKLRAIAAILPALKYLEPQRRSGLAKQIAQRAAVTCNELMMSDAQVCRLAKQGIDIGAHTADHPILARISRDTARQEIIASREYLQGLLQQEVRAFAYPNGKPGQDYLPVHRDMVAESGFQVAVATHMGVASPASDQFQLPRFTPWDKTPMRFALRLLAGYRRLDPLLVADPASAHLTAG